MKQNKYDDPEFFARYSELSRSLGGPNKAWEWPAFRALLPDLSDKRVLDLGCGFGWHCRYAREQQARSVVGVDISEKMLSRARQTTQDAGIEYRHSAVEDIDFGADEFDIVLSSLALHYVPRFDLLCEKVHRCLIADGTFIFSVEHPIFTAIAAQEWHRGEAGDPLHWPVDHYQLEGARHTDWLAKDVIKYHRTIASYINTLIDSGFRISRLAEPAPADGMVQEQPELKDEHRRPTFLVIAAVNGSKQDSA